MFSKQLCFLHQIHWLFLPQAVVLLLHGGQMFLQRGGDRLLFDQLIIQLRGFLLKVRDDVLVLDLLLHYFQQLAVVLGESSYYFLEVNHLQLQVADRLPADIHLLHHHPVLLLVPGGLHLVVVTILDIDV